MIDRVGENNKLVAPYMTELDFQVRVPILGKDLIEVGRDKRAVDVNSGGAMGTVGSRERFVTTIYSYCSRQRFEWAEAPINSGIGFGERQR